MNYININEEKTNNSLEYQQFVRENQGNGFLRIRAYGASEAIPIEGISIIVSTPIGDNNVIFFEGKTDASGMIKRLELPAPKRNSDNLITPKWTIYNIKASYEGSDINYKVNLYDGVCVQQIINMVPDNPVRGYNYGR